MDNNQENEISISMLENLIANIEAGNVNALNRMVIKQSDDTFEVRVLLQGCPDHTI